MAGRQKVVLYNPRAVFYAMPLALVAVGSALDPERYDVVVIDGRLERDLVAKVASAAEGALVLGVTTLTGAPLRDALAVTRAVRARHPRLPIVWGGWHASLFPGETLGEVPIDAVVVGQGEETFAEIVDGLAAGESIGNVAGAMSATERDDDGRRGVAARPVRDVNAFPAHDYGLIDVERYFALKGVRQLDYISSQGCRFRCAFCADPFVYGRSWSGYAPERIGAELAALWDRYRFTDVSFQDETFFTSVGRVVGVSEELLARDLRFSWTATMRADQGARLGDDVLALARRAGLRRVMVGVEAGTQAMMDWMRKDVRVDQVIEAAERCARSGVGAIFNFIVGFPGENDASVRATLALAKRLRRLSRNFEIALFGYRPYPGSEIARDVAGTGYGLPGTIEEWASFDFVGSPSPWLRASLQREIEAFRFYQRVGWGRRSVWRAPLQAVARWRCDHDRYEWPVEKRLIEWWRPPPQLS